MDAFDRAFMSEGFLESFKDLGRVVRYVPTINSVRDKFGDMEFMFLEDKAVMLDCFFGRELYTDQDMAKNYTGRINAECTFVLQQLLDKGVSIKERDAIDVFIDGQWQRFLVTGYPKDPKLFEVFVKVKITDLANAFKAG